MTFGPLSCLVSLMSSTVVLSLHLSKLLTFQTFLPLSSRSIFYLSSMLKSLLLRPVIYVDSHFMLTMVIESLVHLRLVFFFV